MRALKSAYATFDTAYNKKATYIFVVPSFTGGGLDGFMVRGRSVGFVTNNADMRTYAHELGHGVFGLEHTFPEIEEGKSNNLMDYVSPTNTASNTHLTHEQWKIMHARKPAYSWFDSEEDAANSEITTFAQGEDISTTKGMIMYKVFFETKRDAAYISPKLDNLCNPIGRAGLSGIGTPDFFSSLNREPDTGRGKELYDKLTVGWAIPCPTGLMQPLFGSSAERCLQDREDYKRRMSTVRRCTQMEVSNQFLGGFFSVVIQGASASSWEKTQGKKLADRFLEKSNTDYFDTQKLSEIMYNTTKGKDMIRGIVQEYDKQFTQVIKQQRQQIDLGANNFLNTPTVGTDNLPFMPNFKREDSRVLFACVGGTQEVRVWTGRSPEIDRVKGTYKSYLYIQLFDSFCAQESDYIRKFDRFDILGVEPTIIATDVIEQGMNAPLLAFWILQFQRNYPPFRTVFTFRVEITSPI